MQNILQNNEECPVAGHRQVHASSIQKKKKSLPELSFKYTEAIKNKAILMNYHAVYVKRLMCLISNASGNR